MEIILNKKKNYYNHRPDKNNNITLRSMIVMLLAYRFLQVKWCKKKKKKT